MKAIVRKSLIIMLLVLMILIITGCSSHGSFETVLYFSELYAIAHGNVNSDGTVNWSGLVRSILVERREDTPYERAVLAVHGLLNPN